MSKYADNPKRALTQRELQAIIEDIDVYDEIDIAYIPPDVDALTDEEFVDEEELGDNDVLPKEAAGTYEVLVQHENNDNESEMPEDDFPMSNDMQSSSAKDNTKKRKLTNIASNISWCKTSIDYESSPQSNETEDLKNLTEILHGKPPTEFFQLFFDTSVMQSIIQYSMKYARDNNRQDFRLDVKDLEKFLGILILSGYHTLAQLHMYWSSDEDKGVQIVKDAMSRNRFISIKQNIHLSNNEDLDKNDKFTKLRPIFDMLNKNYIQFGIFKQNLSIDEQMVPYFGRHSAKMFIKGKPVRFGFKLWCLTSSDGYLFQFMPYAGKAIQYNQNGLGLGGNVVMELLATVNNPDAHKIYFDNFFTSYQLMVHLKEKGFYATGTVRENRIGKCPLETSKTVGKKARGYYDYRYDHDNEVSVVRWNDNSVVTVISNCESIEPLTTVKRYNRKEQKDVAVTQPGMISKYNRSMGGVDLHDNGIANYRIKIRGKKWWWPLFINLIDSALVNAWKLYRFVHSEQRIPMSQIDFRSEVVRCLLKQNKAEKSFSHRGRASGGQLNEIRFDNVGHIVQRNEKGWRRRCKFCKSQTIFTCIKCKVPLHTECFSSYHKK